jgi:hypothetical protein
MEKILQTMRYLSTGFILMLAIGFGSLLGNVLFTNLIFYVTDRDNIGRAAGPLTVPLEMTASVFALLIGLLLLRTNFKVVIANGISRRTFLFANLPVALLAAAALALFNGMVVLVHGFFWPAVLFIQLIYPQVGWAGLLLVQFGLYFMLIAAGWVITLAYYRASVPRALVDLAGALRADRPAAGDQYRNRGFGNVIFPLQPGVCGEPA